MRKRRWATAKHERLLWRAGRFCVAGVDEAGRGAWAGPIAAAAVILPPDYRLRVADSKLLMPQERERLFVAITGVAVAWAVAFIEVTDIDATGIERANHRVVLNAVGRLGIAPDVVLADSIRLNPLPDRWQTFVDGDATIGVIAAASIIAKVARDSVMRQHHRLLPQWRFDQHKGYGTDEHWQRLQTHGLSPIHRRSFLPMKLG